MLKRILLGGMAAGALLLSAGGTHAVEATDISKLKNKSPVSLSGTVTNVREHEFTLLYGDNKTIDVDVEHWRNSDLSRMVRDGQKVSVAGQVETRLFDDTEIVPYSLTNMSTDIEYQTKPPRRDRSSFRTGDENMADGIVLQTPTKVQGEIKNIRGRTMQVQTASGLVTIDTRALPYDPTGDKVFPELEIGDTVSFLGELRQNRIQAQKIVNIRKPYKAQPYTSQVIAPRYYKQDNDD